MTTSNRTQIRSLIAAGALLLASQYSRAASYYVAVNGSNTNPGTSASPFLTIQRGVDVATAGDTVIVRDGNYSAGAVINKAGNSSAWITVKAEHKWKAVLNCSVSCHDLFALGGSSAYIVIQDFDIGYTKNAGVFSNSGGGRNIRVLGNHIHHIGAGVYDSTPYGLMGVYTDSSAANWTIDGNVINDCGRAAVLTGSHDHGLYLHGTNMVVTNNVFYRVPNGWHIQTAAGFSGTIANNTFYGSNMYPGKLGAMTLWDPNSNVIVRNNIFYDPIGYAIVSWTLSMSGYCYIDNNIVYKPSGSAGLMDSMPSNCVQSNNRLGVDPRLVNPSLPNYDFHLTSVSPAINAGSASAVPPADFDGVTRPQGAGYDIGAFEFGGTPAPAADTTAPVVSGVAASGVGQNGATIAWTTNEAADTQVEYGATAAYGASTVLNAALSTNHGAILSGLTAGTFYHYRVRSKDAAGNLGVSGDLTLTTAAPTPVDASAPVLSVVSAAGVSQSGASIGWTTNELADTQVEYGPTAAYGASTVLNSALSLSHSATLSGLSSGTLYHFRVKSKDAAGNLAASPDATFTTSAAAPAPGCIVSAGAWKNTALAPQTGTFTLEFDATPGTSNMDGVSGPSNGAAADYNALALAVGFSNAGTLVARNGGAYSAAAVIPYVAGLTYHFRLVVNIPAHTYSAYVKQGVNAEQVLGSNYAFRTEQAAVTTLNNLGMYAPIGSQTVCAAAVTAAGAPADITAPVIGAVSAASVSQSGASIGWTTNEAADTQVEYGPTTAYGASTVLNSTLSTSHVAVLSGLSAGTLYHYRVKSKDAAGNLATSPDAVFTTAAAAPAPGCIVSAGAWKNTALAAQTGTFTLEFDASPATANLDAVSGPSNGAAADYNALALAVGFSNSGYLVARNGGAYAAASPIPYVAGLTYHFRLVVNIPAHTYSVYVKQGAGAEQLLGSNYAFRTEQAAVTTLNNLGMYAATGSQTVCAAAVTASALADTTPPVILGVSASAASQTGATIGWTTNEASDTQVEYGPTTAYGASTVLNSTLSTSHVAALSGLSAGTLYRYRVKSRDAAGNLATSPDSTFTTSAPVPVVSCINSAGAWANMPLAPQSGSFTVEFDATPGAGNIDGVSGLSNGAASDYSKLAAIVRFNSTGAIDARNGGVYAAASRIPYVSGLTYHFRLDVSLTSRKYSAYVKQGAGAEILIGGNYSFRAEQSALTTINNLGLFSSAGSEKICGAVVR